MKLTIYGKAPGCIYCHHAIDLCRQEGVDFDFIDITHNEELTTMVKQRWGTVPMVLDGERLIGGYTELYLELSNISL